MLTGLLLGLMTCSGALLKDMTPPEVDALLGRLLVEQPAFEARLSALARAGLGTPYEAGPLGEGPDGAHDQDPLMDLGRVDCVTYVEQTAALAASSSHAEAFALLQRIRYRDGVIGYEERNHFLVTDWLPNNPWARDVTAALGAPLAETTRTISRREFFARVGAEGLGADTPDKTVTVAYLPREHAAAHLDAFPDPALVVFIGARPDWLFALHCGFYLRAHEGGGKLYHASSRGKGVVAEDLAAYIESQERYLGVMVYALESPAPVETSGGPAR